MKLLEMVHGAYVANRRVQRLANRIAPLISEGVRVLDVGCGDGRLAKQIRTVREDIDFCGVEVIVRDDTAIPVTKFDGRELPFDDQSFDAVLFVDVLHHSLDAEQLLREAKRVAKSNIVIKDHLLEGWLAYSTLRFMDQIGNRRFGVDIPCNYWTREKWQETFDGLDLLIRQWSGKLQIYPQPASLVFDRSLHFTCVLDANSASAC